MNKLIFSFHYALTPVMAKYKSKYSYYDRLTKPPITMDDRSPMFASKLHLSFDSNFTLPRTSPNLFHTPCSSRDSFAGSPVFKHAHSKQVAKVMWSAIRLWFDKNFISVNSYFY